MTDKLQDLVWIIVLHWQGSDYTRACLRSLGALTYGNYKILLVDNGSPDQSGTGIASEFPAVSLLQTGKNLGFSGGCNAGIDYCLNHGASWIWLLNNDTTVEKESLSQLMAVAEKNSRSAALGALVIDGTDAGEISSGAGEIDFRRAKTFLRKTAPDGTTCLECDWLSGSNLLVRAAAIKEIGTFNDDYFLYFEDTDLCWRMRQAGWSCLFVPQAKIRHTGGGSTEGKRSYWRAYYYTRNRLLFFLSHSSGASAIAGLASVSGHIIRHLIVLPFRGDSGRKKLLAELLGLRDYVFKRLGKATCLDWCE